MWPDLTGFGAVSFANGGDTLELPAPWVFIEDLSPLWFPGPQRAKSQLLPHTGEIVTNIYQDPAEYGLRVELNERVMFDGSPVTTPLRCLRANVGRILSFATADPSGEPLLLASTFSQDGESDTTAETYLEVINPEIALTSGRLTLVVHVSAGGYV